MAAVKATLSLAYTAPPPTGHVTLATFHDGFSIEFNQPIPVLRLLRKYWPLVLLVLATTAPVLVLGSIQTIRRAGWWGAVEISCVIALPVVLAVVWLTGLRQGPVLEVRGGRVAYRVLDSRRLATDWRECDADDVAAVHAAPDRLVIRLKQGIDLLSGPRPTNIPGYRHLPLETRAWIETALSAALGLDATTAQEPISQA